ncbi:energy transducer TonB [Parasphingorhabdus sp.]|uniref:energy transducer TonB n=1 Tax=Parasphingorhabdus sp. TaxID=2709688 RepID=UPI0030018BDB
MSYVSVYENNTPRSKGLLLAGGVHAVIIAAVIAMPGIEVPDRFNGPFTAIPIAKPQPPEPVIEDKEPETKPAGEKLQKLPQRPAVDIGTNSGVPESNYAEFSIGAGSSGTDGFIPIEPIRITPDPVIVDARLNNRYAAQFQPAYPTGQLRREAEGVVSVRVLVGSDGRVKQIELIDSPHEDFWLATRKQALRSWRFEPATRDGTPVESWLTLKVRFEINS